MSNSTQDTVAPLAVASTSSRVIFCDPSRLLCAYSIIERPTGAYAQLYRNRLIKITYPGSGNNSQFTYDGFGRNVEIVETVSGSVTSTKQFVWADGDRCEQRNASSSVTAQFFPLGEIISGTDYFFTTDHLGLTDAMMSSAQFSQGGLLGGHPGGFSPVAHTGSTREMTNSSGTIQSQFAYDPYGRSSVLQGSTPADMQYAGYYQHAASGLSLTLNREYSPSLGHWISRDPTGEFPGWLGSVDGGLDQPRMSALRAENLYDYVGNEPVGRIDMFGLDYGLPTGGPAGLCGLIYKYCMVICLASNLPCKKACGPLCQTVFADCMWGVRGHYPKTLGPNFPTPLFFWFDLLPIENQWNRIMGRGLVAA